MKMFSFSRPNERYITHLTDKFPQTLIRNSGSIVHRLLGSDQNQTVDLLVARNEIVSASFLLF